MATTFTFNAGTGTLVFGAGGGPSPTITITSISSTGTVGGTIAASGAYTVAAPPNLIGAWSGGGGTPTTTGFSASGGTWNANFSVPGTPATYTLTVQGSGSPNTATSGPSSNVVVSGGGSPTLTITSNYSNGTVGGTIGLTFADTVAAPSGLTALWSGGGGSATVSGFSASGATGSATITTPGTPGTYTFTITGTGPNTATSAASASVVISAAGTPVLVQSFAMQNWNGAAASAGFARQGVMFRKGDVPAGTALTLKRGAAVIDAQFDQRVYSTDGSLKFAVMHMRDTPLAASVSQTYDLWTAPSTSFNNAGTRSISDLTAHDFKVVFTNVKEAPLYLTSLNSSGTGNPDNQVYAPTGANTAPINVIITNLTGTGVTLVIETSADAGATWSTVATVTTDGTTVVTSPANKILQVRTTVAVDHINPGVFSTQVVGSGTYTASGNTHLNFSNSGVNTRLEKYHSGPVCESWMVWGMATDNTGGVAHAHLKTTGYFSIWKNANGSIYDIEFAFAPELSWWSIATKNLMEYTATLMDGGTTIATYADGVAADLVGDPVRTVGTGVVHTYQSAWMTVTADSSYNRGRRFWRNTTMPTLTYKPDRAYQISTGLVPPLDITRSTTSVYLSQAPRSDKNTTYLPGSSFNHRPGIDGTGGYMGRGVLPLSDTIAFVSQDPLDIAIARLNNFAGLHIVYMRKSNRTRVRPGDSGVADTANTVISQILSISDNSHAPYDFTSDGMPIPVYAYAEGRSDPAFMDGYIGVPSTGPLWFPSSNTSHAVAYSAYMYMFEGERHFLEANLHLAAATVENFLSGDPFGQPKLPVFAVNTGQIGQQPVGVIVGAPTTIYNAIGSIFEQVRSIGWSMQLHGYAAGLVPNENVAAGFIRRLHKQQCRYLKDYLFWSPTDFKDAGITPQSLNTAVGESGNWLEAVSAQGCLTNARLTEDPDALAYGLMLANLAINEITHGCYYTESYRIMPRQNMQKWDPVTNLNLTFPWAAEELYGHVQPGANTITWDILMRAGIPPSNGDTVEGCWIYNNNSYTVDSNGTPLDPLYPGGRVYYVINASGITCQLSLTLGGSPIDLTNIGQWDRGIAGNTIASGGSGYALLDTFRVNTNAAVSTAAGSAACTGIVTGVSGGVVTGIAIRHGSGHAVANGIGTTTLTGTGTGLTINITSISYTADNFSFSARIAAYDADTVAGTPYGSVPAQDAYSTIACAAIVMAYRQGNPRATLALVNKQRTFLSNVNVIGGSTWDMAP